MDFSEDFEHLLASPDASAFAGSDIDALVARQIQEAVAAASIDDKSDFNLIQRHRRLSLTSVS